MDRLYYTDSYLSSFRAVVTENAGDRVYLDRSAFYPSSGGQPNDLGTIADVPVLDVIDEGERVAHVTAAPIEAREVECSIDWVRRFDHMQQHTGQHLLSAVLADLFGAQTVGFHLGSESSAIDVTAGSLTDAQVAQAERRANEIVFENHDVRVSFEDAAEALAAGVRKRSDREGTLRVITIDGVDRSACGGTHVRATGEIGPVLIRKLDRAHGATRVEFLCGFRAVRRARSDYDLLAGISRTLTAPLDETAALVASQAEALAAAEKARRKLAAELAAIRGRELYAATAPDAGGVRCHVLRISKGALDEETRAMAQGFTAGTNARFLAVADDPPSVLLAVSKDAGLNAGNAVKQAVAAVGGRGGGSVQVAQGSVPSRDALNALLAELTSQLTRPGG
jgi:alanyl-tRNA synthetase